MRMRHTRSLLFWLSCLLLGISGCQEPTAVPPPPQSPPATPPTQPTAEIELHYQKSIKPGEVLSVQATNHSHLPITFFVPYNGDYCLHIYQSGRLVPHLPELACDVYASLLIEPGMTRFLLAWDGMLCDGNGPACEQRRPASPGTYTFDLTYEQPNDGEVPLKPVQVEGIFVVVP